MTSRRGLPRYFHEFLFCTRAAQISNLEEALRQLKLKMSALEKEHSDLLITKVGFMPALAGVYGSLMIRHIDTMHRTRLRAAPLGREPTAFRSVALALFRRSDT